MGAPLEAQGVVAVFLSWEPAIEEWKSIGIVLLLAFSDRLRFDNL